MSEEPLILNVKKEDKDIYDEIRKNGPLKGKSTKEVFLLAAMLGFNKRVKIDIGGNQTTYVRTEYLNNEDKALINSIAIYDSKNLEILQDKKEVFKIIEEYAHSGLLELKEMVLDKDTGTFMKKFEAFLRDLINLENEIKGSNETV